MFRLLQSCKRLEALSLRYNPYSWLHSPHPLVPAAILQNNGQKSKIQKWVIKAEAREASEIVRQPPVLQPPRYNWYNREDGKKPEEEEGKETTKAPPVIRSGELGLQSQQLLDTELELNETADAVAAATPILDVTHPVKSDAPSESVPEAQVEPYRVHNISASAGFRFRADFSNVYATKRIFSTAQPGRLRMIIIDGMNVGWGYGHKAFRYEGVIHCINFFRARGHRVKVFLPRHQISHIPEDVVDQLNEDGILVVTPSRNPGNERRINAYDDRFIVQYAAMTDGIIISNDNFNDLFKEEPSWRETIRKRVLPHTWVDREVLMFQLDPQGRNKGMRLNEYLRHSNGTSFSFSI